MIAFKIRKDKKYIKMATAADEIVKPWTKCKDVCVYDGQSLGS